MQQAGVSREDAHLSAALKWLRSHQDEAGFWDAQSLNKKYEAGSMPAQFMRDSATAFAAMALLQSH